MVFTYKIQKWSDIETSTTKVTCLNVGVAGNEIRNRCQPFIQAFKYYRVLGMKVSLIPASTLPADPSQISYETGENAVNPADMMNVGLVRYTNGEAFPYYAKLTGEVTAGVAFDYDPGMQTYFNMMLDRRWSKFGMQRGMSRFFRPRVYDDGLPIQSICPDENISYLKADNGSYTVQNSQMNPGYATENKPGNSVGFTNGQYPRLVDLAVFGTSDAWRMQTGKLKPLGWMPTDVAHLGHYMNSSSADVGAAGDMQVGFNTFPFINMGRIILPRAMKTKFAFRVVQTIIVQFRGAVNISPENDAHYRYLADRGIYTPGAIKTVPENVTGGAFWGGNQV
uniref:Capsid protein n=1 Tax=Cressdnaviricota sp. TaxID=2748378 RepID=A0A6M4B8X4_9VIRU|nr:capsid protein [Cressdnaviricota sp.]